MLRLVPDIHRVLSAIVLTVSISTFASAQSPAADESGAGGAKSGSAKKTDDAKTPGDDVRRPAGRADPAENVNLLERAIERMRLVQKRIHDGDTGGQTRKLQSEIVTDLQELIDLARQLRPPQNPPREPEQNAQPQQTRKSAGDPNSQAGSAANQASKGGDDPTDRIEKGRDSEAARARQRQNLKEIWGMLPPALREKMLNVYSEKYLPRYEDLVRDYFEALAEQSRSSTDR